MPFYYEELDNKIIKPDIIGKGLKDNGEKYYCVSLPPYEVWISEREIIFEDDKEFDLKMERFKKRVKLVKERASKKQ